MKHSLSSDTTSTISDAERLQPILLDTLEHFFEAVDYRKDLFFHGIYVIEQIFQQAHRVPEGKDALREGSFAEKVISSLQNQGLIAQVSQGHSIRFIFTPAGEILFRTVYAPYKQAFFARAVTQGELETSKIQGQFFDHLFSIIYQPEVDDNDKESDAPDRAVSLGSELDAIFENDAHRRFSALFRTAGIRLSKPSDDIAEA